MDILFKDITPGFFKARVCEIQEKKGRYGSYLLITFCILEQGELFQLRFSGIVNPSPLKQGKFYRWVKTILGQEPNDFFSTSQMIGKQCRVFLSKKGGFYSVSDVSLLPDDSV